MEAYVFLEGCRIPFLDVYISNRTDADPDDTGLATETPTRRSPFFTEGHKARKLFFHWRDSGIIEATQTDWAAWVAFVTKQEIEDFFEHHYSDISYDEDFAHLEEERRELQRYIEQLNPDIKYALCATEL